MKVLVKTSGIFVFVSALPYMQEVHVGNTVLTVTENNNP